MKKRLRRWWLAFLISLSLPGGQEAAGEAVAKPLAQQYSVSLSPVVQEDAYGPLLSRKQNDSQTTWTFAPLFSRAYDPAVEATEVDVLYPLITYDRFGSEYRFQVMQVFSFSGGQNQNAVPTDRFTLFPIFFRQRSPDTNQNYTAVGPFYGDLKHRLMRDEIKFVMFPLYARSRKQDVVTDNYLFPFFHKRRGQELHGWQFWPLAGWEQKGVTSVTNTIDEIETVGGHKKFFAFWPVYFNETTGIGTENPQKYTALLPLFTRQRSPKRDSTTYIWPLFTITNDREKKYREWDAPWPLIVFARGEGKTANRIWPLFGHAHNENLESDFCLWPLYKYNRFHGTEVERERTRILFFLYSDMIEKEPGATNSLHRTDLWPLFTARRDRDGNERFQILSLLEPILPTSKSIERDYSPVWAVWRSEKDAKTGATRQAALWNLYRREKGPDIKKFSLLFGLFQYESRPEGKRWRLFYLPAAKAKSRSAIQGKS